MTLYTPFLPDVDDFPHFIFFSPAQIPASGLLTELRIPHITGRR